MDFLSDSSLYGMHLYQDRILTFHNWPRQIIPDKFSLPQAGFYYTGQSDVTVCFACNLKVNQWERHDKPLEEHKRLSPDCRFLKMFGYGETIQKEEATVEMSPFTFIPNHTSPQIQKTCALPFLDQSTLFSK